jgi:hypothetical protein
MLKLALANACDLEVIGFAKLHTGDENAVAYDGDGGGIGSAQCCFL